MEALRADRDVSVRLIHTGQHFDAEMSQVFFEQLGMPEPDAYLDVNQGSPTTQIAAVMSALEKQFLEHPTDLVLVFGDVNSTLAAALVANKMGLPLAHVEAGLRSFDRSMPEEHNRILTDMLADYLFTPSPDADENLLREGINPQRIFRVGNIMVDSLLRFIPLAEGLDAWKELGLEKGGYGLVTLHRPANVDKAEALGEILSALMEIAASLPLVFPVHPRTEAQLLAASWKEKMAASGIILTAPLSYLEFMNLMLNARLVLTDSGGIQEESTVLGVSCLTMRENTERPITINEGTNQLVGIRKAGILQGFERAMQAKAPQARKPHLWDGHTAQRIHEILKAL